MEEIKEYGVPFLIGGTVVAAIKYTSHHMSQKYAAIPAAMPLGLLSTLFIIEANKTDSYIKNYTIIMSFTILEFPLLKKKIIHVFFSFFNKAWIFRA